LATPTSASLVKRNLSLKIFQNLEDFSIEVGFLLSLQQPPVLVVTIKPQGDPETASSTGDKRLCLAPIPKMSHFQQQIMSQFFQTFVLNFPPGDPGWSLDGEVNRVEKHWLCSVEHLGLLIFINRSTHMTVFRVIAHNSISRRRLLSPTLKDLLP